MKIFPAIDILDGNVVRLRQGDYDKKQVYGDDPAAVAKGFLETGASYLHVVDLNGAKDGQLVNFDIIAKLGKVKGLFAEVGGGIRDEGSIEKYLSCGIKRVILGTIAVKNPAFVKEMVKKYGKAIAVGVDAKKGMVAVSGWQETTRVSSLDFCKRLYEEAGVSTIIYTDIEKDGEMSGTNLNIYKKLRDIKGLDIIASGGISTLEEIKALKQMGMYGAILGKSLYVGAISLKEALEIAGKEEKI